METTLEKLEHIENLLTILIDGFKRIEDKKIEIPEQVNYRPSFKKLGEQFDQLSNQAGKADKLIAAIEDQRNTVKNLIDGLPRKIRTQVEHRFSDRTRPYIIIFVVAVFVAALSLVGCISLLFRNSDLKENDIKFRMVRLRKPTWVKQIDADYFKNSDSLERLVKFEEQKVIAFEKAMQEVQQNEKDSEASKERLKNLR
ncbi:hypothetical protein [Pedobacter sp. JCM 36344]|uniref:hypothetical protein n=1 Tax=Pedobacter sp. JCM 36344 TaxID=3374280 RepID=UPI00397C9717